MMVWRHESIAAMRAGTFGTSTKEHQSVRGHDCAVRCFCDAGQRLGRGIPTFDPARDCPCENRMSDEDIEALREFCNPHNQAKAMGNYDSSLAEF